MTITTIGIPSDDLECACLYLESGLRTLLRQGYSIDEVQSLFSMIVMDITEAHRFRAQSEN